MNAVKQLINERLFIVDSTVTIIGEFTILWQLFEKKYCGKFCRIGKLENIANSASKTDHDGALTQTIANFRTGVTDWATPLKFDLNNVATKFRFETKALAQKATDFLSNTEKDFAKQVHGALLVLYRLRNNLLHGEKEEYLFNNQADMFIRATGVLFALHNLKP